MLINTSPPSLQTPSATRFDTARSSKTETRFDTVFKNRPAWKARFDTILFCTHPDMVRYGSTRFLCHTPRHDTVRHGFQVTLRDTTRPGTRKASDDTVRHAFQVALDPPTRHGTA